MKANTVTWLILVVLTSVSFAASEPSGLRTVAPLILGLAGIKALVVTAQFMELRRAHPAWMTGIATLVIAVLAAVGILI